MPDIKFDGNHDSIIEGGKFPKSSVFLKSVEKVSRYPPGNGWNITRFID